MTEGPGPWSVLDSRTGSVVSARVVGAHTFWGRFRGLMGRASLPVGEGLYLADSSIHMFNGKDQAREDEICNDKFFWGVTESFRSVIFPRDRKPLLLGLNADV